MKKWWCFIKMDRLQTQFSVRRLSHQKIFSHFWPNPTETSHFNAVTCRTGATSDHVRDKWPVYRRRTRQVTAHKAGSLNGRTGLSSIYNICARSQITSKSSGFESSHISKQSSEHKIVHTQTNNFFKKISEIQFLIFGAENLISNPLWHVEYACKLTWWSVNYFLS